VHSLAREYGVQSEHLWKNMVEAVCVSRYCLPSVETESLLTPSQTPHLDFVLREQNLIYILSEIQTGCIVLLDEALSG